MNYLFDLFLSLNKSGLIFSIILSFVLSVIITIIVKKIALKYGIVDIPNKRKIHSTPIPLLGGISIFFSFTITLIIHNLLYEKFSLLLNKDFIAILLGALIIHIVGIVDDIKNVSPKTKLIFQTIAAIIAVTGGNITDLFIKIKLINIIITISWIVIITNSFNLLDNMDGLSCGIGAITSFLFFIVNINQGQYYLAMFSLILAFSCLGFLIFNFSPASIFMGDGGSLVIGYLISIIAVKGIYLKFSLLTRLPVLIPLLILFIPLYDTCSVIFIRLKIRQSIFKADKRHFSHRLVNLGLTKNYAVFIIYLATISTGITATLLPKLKLVDALIIIIHNFMVFGIIAILEWFSFKKYESDN